MIVGSTWNPKATFRDGDGQLYDPTTVTADSISPTGVVASATVTPISTGVYLISIPLTEAGFWFVEVTGTGPDTLVAVDNASTCATASLVLV
jgi:hypothetical protein